MAHAILVRNLSIQDAASLLGLTRPTISNIMNGRCEPGYETMLRFSRVFGHDAIDLATRQARYLLGLERRRLSGIISTLRAWTPNMSDPNQPADAGEKEIIVHEGEVEGSTVATVVQGGKAIGEYASKEEAQGAHPDAKDTELPPKTEPRPNE